MKGNIKINIITEIINSIVELDISNNISDYNAEQNHLI